VGDLVEMPEVVGVAPGNEEGENKSLSPSAA